VRVRRALALVAFIALIAGAFVLSARTDAHAAPHDHASFAALVTSEVAAPVLLTAPVRVPSARSVDGVVTITLAAAAVALIAARAKRIVPPPPRPARRSLSRARRGPPLQFVFA
jgi:hypothetical protein